MSSPSAILLAFANDWNDRGPHLRSLLEESKAISKALAPLVEAGQVGLPPPIHNATLDEVITTFREHRDRDPIRIFHFGGHADGARLLFEDEDGANAAAHATSLAAYLGRQPELVLVFLNGCCTAPQVRRLRASGVKAVVATTAAIQDTLAAEFARAFYAELTARPLRDAFETAVLAMQLRWGDDPAAVTRDVASPGKARDSAWPWILDCDPDHEAWSLGAERKPRSPWWRPLLFATAALSLLVAMSDDVPTQAERASWADALRQSSGTGLRAYLRDYPEGAHANEARSRLAGCWTEQVETLGPEREVPFVWTVNPSRARPLSTEAEARGEALERGNRDAEVVCAPLRGNAQLLSARARPGNWNCPGNLPGFSCGFDGEIVCRVRDRIRAALEHCR